MTNFDLMLLEFVGIFYQWFNLHSFILFFTKQLNNSLPQFKLDDETCLIINKQVDLMFFFLLYPLILKACELHLPEFSGHELLYVDIQLFLWILL